MKPSKMRPLSPIMERHTPQHPLPEEIKELPKGETVCQFCGVSYLIHHEIKKLEEKIVQLENELEEYYGSAEREEKLRGELERGKNALSSLNQLIAQKDKTIEEITHDYEKQQETSESLQKNVTRLQEEYRQLQASSRSSREQYVANLRKLEQVSKLVKARFSTLQDDTEFCLKEFADFFRISSDKIADKSQFCAQEMSAMKAERTRTMTQLRAAEAERDEWRSRSRDTETRSRDVQAEIEQLRSRLDERENSRTSAEDKLQKIVDDLTRENSELTQRSNKFELEMKSMKSELAQLEDKLRTKQNELQQAVVRCQQTDAQANATIKRLTQDQREVENELFAAKKDLQRVKQSQSEQQRAQDALRHESHLRANESGQLQKSLDGARESVRALIEERERMVSSHQLQIEQLRESFKRKLEAATRPPPDPHQEEERMRRELAQLEAKMKKDFRLELALEADKRLEQVASLKEKHKREMQEMDAECDRRCERMRREISALKQNLEIANENFNIKDKEFEDEKRSLKQLIAQLEERIAKLSAEQDDAGALARLELESVVRKSRDAEQRVDQLEQEAIAMNDEISLLQDTVRRECEERFELTEALSQARDQLLAHKIPPNFTPTSNVHSTLNIPVSVLGKLAGPPAPPRGHDPSGAGAGGLSARIASTGVDSSPVNGRSPNSRPLMPAFSNGSSPHPNNPSPPSVTSPATRMTSQAAKVRELSFDSQQSRKSTSGGSPNHQRRGGAGDKFEDVRGGESVDQVRRRIAAAIKRK